MKEKALLGALVLAMAIVLIRIALPMAGSPQPETTTARCTEWLVVTQHQKDRGPIGATHHCVGFTTEERP